MIKSNSYMSGVIRQLYRDFQIQIIIQGRQFSIDEKNYQEFIKSDKYQVFKKYTPDEIITGSASLKLFGLLSRDIIDIDVVITDENKFSPYQKLFYSGESLESYIGTKYFKWKKYTWDIFSEKKTYAIDFFKIDDTTEYIEYKGLKIETPMGVIKHKIEIADKGGMTYSDKHVNDLVLILNSGNFIMTDLGPFGFSKPPTANNFMN